MEIRATLGRVSAVPPPPSTEPGPGPGPAPASGRRTGRRRLGIVALVVLGVLAAVCFGGLGFAYLVYDRATQPDRSTPTLAVRQYVDSTFANRDPGRAKLFTCGSPHLQDVQNLLSDLKAREKRFNISITVSLADMDSTTRGTSGTVEADLRIDTPESDGGLSRSSQRWRFGVVRESGWRVCDAHKIG